MHSRRNTVFLNRSRAISGALAVILSVGAAVDASAADNTQDQPPQSDQIQEIIVHAQRIGESLQKVPVSVTTVTGDELDSRKLNDLSQISLAVPSLAVSESNYYSVRGVGTIAGSALLDSSVGVSIDDVSLGVPGFMSNGILDDVSQIEVLSGPQGLLFGRNASAGLINILSNRPVIGKFEGSVSGEFDDRDSDPAGHFGGILRATVNLPVSDTSALRLNLNESYQDPITKLVNPNPPGVNREAYQENAGIKAKYLWRPDDKLTVYLIGDYGRVQGYGGGPFDLSSGVTSPFGLTQLGLTADGITSGSRNLKAGADGPYYSGVNSGGFSANVSYQLSPALTISNIAAWRTFHNEEAFDADVTSLPIFNEFTDVTSYNQYSDELRFAFKPNTFIDGQAGLYLFAQDQKGNTHQLGAVLTGMPNYVGSDVIFDLKGHSIAEFGQVNLHATDELQFLAGARVTSDHVSIDQTQNVGDYIIALGPRDQHIDQSYSDTNVSYKVGSQYQFTQDIMAYVSYGTGYKGPSFNSSASVVGENLTVFPEKNNNLEVGVKTTFFDRRLRLDLAGFIEHFKQLQVQNYDLTTQTFVIGNAGSARTKGIEFTGVAKPFGGLTINFGATVLDAVFTNFPGDPCYTGQALASCATTGAFNGARLAIPTAAKFTGTVQAIYEFPISAGTTGFVEGNFYHRTPVGYSTAGDPLLVLGDVNTLGLSVGTRINGFEVSLFCKNCTNKYVPTALDPNSVDSFVGADSVLQQWGYNSIRTLGVTASYKF